eukprot:CAMPEP_0173418596 /NCGR_PEP_ID=MMETSP1357-20121228/689_1 /TAXON_ID=77926 /ORGANISM="Hemiselmis rufescens, Strain PCC563" /LENGTH=113 /DNA_ID=CAMNT_0014381111 /DNA_START=719 /DNA_END=1060 /DNA_ORIENTATION=+
MVAADGSSNATAASPGRALKTLEPLCRRAHAPGWVTLRRAATKGRGNHHTQEEGAPQELPVGTACPPLGPHDQLVERDRRTSCPAGVANQQGQHHDQERKTSLKTEPAGAEGQ